MTKALWLLYVVGAPTGRFTGVGAFEAFEATLAFPIAFAASCAALAFLAGLFGPFGVSGMTHSPHKVNDCSVIDSLLWRYQNG